MFALSQCETNFALLSLCCSGSTEKAGPYLISVRTLEFEYDVNFLNSELFFQKVFFTLMPTLRPIVLQRGFWISPRRYFIC